MKKAAERAALTLNPIPPVALHIHRRAHRDPLVEVDHVLVEHAHAAGGDLLADAPGLVGAVDAEQDVPAVLVEIEGAGAERVVEARLAVARQVGLEADHGAGGRPGGPDALAADRGDAAPGEPLLADADAVADRPALGLDEIEHALVDIDHDGAGLLGAVIGYRLAGVSRVHPAAVDEGHVERLVGDRTDIPAG